MQRSSIIDPGAVRFVSGVSNKKRPFQIVGDLAAEVYGVSNREATRALTGREALGSTGVGKGIALPHARLAELTDVIGVFVRLDRPVDFNAVDRLPVDLIFALFAPVEAGVDHLKALALVSRTLRDGSVCSKLRSNDDPGTLHAVLTEITAEAA